jgi:predicted kinase
MYGPPAAGKSTYAESQAGVVVVDFERLVMENNATLFGGFLWSPATWRKAEALASEALRRGEDVIFDYFATEWVFRKLLRYLAYFADVPARVVIFDVPLDVCLARNAGRSGPKRLPVGKVKSMFDECRTSRERVAAEPWASVTIQRLPDDPQGSIRRPPREAA